MAGGKSTQCLIEEISYFTDGLTPFFQLDPVEAARRLNFFPPASDFTGCTVDEIPEVEGLNVVNGFFANTMTHLQIEVSNPSEVNGPDHDWHMTSYTDTKTTFLCSITNDTLTITKFKKELSTEILNTFSQQAVDARRTSSEEVITPASCYNTLGRVIKDLITGKDGERRDINATNPSATKFLDLHAVLPALGFEYVETENKYKAPETLNQEDLLRLRRLYLEARILARDAKVDLGTYLGKFFNVATTFRKLGPANYLGLGASSNFPDGQIIWRYRLQVQNDPQNTHYYLEFLRTIAESRASEEIEAVLLEAISMGAQTSSQIEHRLKTIGLDLETMSQLSDDQILELVYQVSDPNESAAIVNTITLLRPDSEDLQRCSIFASMSAMDALNRLEIYDETQENKEVLHKLADIAADHDDVISRTMTKYILVILGVHRKSALLLSTYDNLFEQLMLPSLEEAYMTLGVNAETDNHFLKMAYVSLWEDTSGMSLLTLRNAFRVIANARNQNDLLEFMDMEEGNEDSDDPQSYSYQPKRDPSVPVGLWNIGNTCYLNSILQFYYSLKPIRDFVIDYRSPQEELKSVNSTEEEPNQELNEPKELEEPKDPKELEDQETTGKQSLIDLDSEDPEKKVEESKLVSSSPPEPMAAESAKKAKTEHTEILEKEEEEQTKKIGGRVVPPKEVRRSQIFVGLLGDLFRQMRDTKDAQVTPAEILAYMALVPPQEDADDVITAASTPHEPNENLRIRLLNALRNQQDVTECIENILYQLEAAMTPTSIDEDGEQIDLVKELFYGTTVQTLARISDGGNRRTKKERYSSLMINVGNGPTSIYDAIESFFAEDVVEVEDGPTLRTLKIETLPKFLQFQVQRVQFDLETFESYKNQNPVVFEPTIYLDRYMETPPQSELDKTNRSVKQWKSDLAAVRAEMESSQELLNLKQSLETTLKWLETATHVSEATAEVIKARYQSICEQLGELRNKEQYLLSKITHGYDNFQKQGYRIHSLFIHRGNVSYGHYWIYIWDPNSQSFFNYNDELVSRISAEQVFDFSKTNRATPYFMVFVREDSMDMTTDLTVA